MIKHSYLIMKIQELERNLRDDSNRNKLNNNNKKRTHINAQKCKNQQE